LINAYDTTFSSTRQSALIAREKHIYISSSSRSFFLDFFIFSRDFYRGFYSVHVLTVFSGLIGPESSRDISGSIFSPFAAFPIFRTRYPRGVPISRGRNFSVSFDCRGASVFLDFNAAPSDRYK